MQGKWGYTGLVGLVVVLLAGLIYDGRQREIDDTFALDTYRLFPFIEHPDQIVRLELVIPAEEFAIAIEVAEDQSAWFLGYDPFIQVDPVLPNQARDFVGLMQGFQVVNRGEASLETFGLLPNPQYVIRFQLDNLSTAELWIGNKTASGEAYYVSPGANSVIVDLVEAFWIDYFVASMLNIEPFEAGADVTPTPSP